MTKSNFDPSERTNKPMAAHGWLSYRCKGPYDKGPYDWIMIGAKDDKDAMVQALRSSKYAKEENLEKWDGNAYVPVHPKSENLTLTTNNIDQPGEEVFSDAQRRLNQLSASRVGYSVHSPSDDLPGWAYCIDGDYSNEYPSEEAAWQAAFIDSQSCEQRAQSPRG